MRFGIALLAAVVVCAAAGAGRIASAQASPKTVLVIHSGNETFPSNPILDAGIRNALTSHRNLSIDYFAEYLENDFFPGSEETQAFANYIRAKYHDRRIDAVITITDTALQFALECRGMLFPDAPIIFSALAGPDEITRNSGAGVTGLRVGIAYLETLKLALTLHPSTEHVFVVASGRADTILDAVHTEFRNAPPNVSITYVSRETVPDLLAAVRAVPPRSVILYIWHQARTPTNVTYPDEIAKLVAEAAPVPVYGTSDLYAGSGVVGGVVRGTRETGDRLGEMAARILTGERAQDIPIAAPRFETYVDWRQLQRWGISESRIPARAVIRFREPSVWDRYRIYVLSAATILVAQTALIGGLLLQRRRRRQAEQELRGNQKELQASYEEIRTLASRALTAQETERSRIARELHDDISQQVAMMTIDLELLRQAGQKDGEQVLERALSHAHELAGSIHSLSHRLHPAKLRMTNLVTALNSLRQEMSRPDLTVSFTHDNVPPALPNELTVCTFRVVQEALQNALKHSKAHDVSVHLRGGNEGLAVLVVDDGVGFEVDCAPAKGLGVISMRERVQAVGGSLEIRSTPGRGTQVEILIPLSSS